MADNLKMELRWLVRYNGDRILQFRQQRLQTQYGQYNDKTGDYWKLPEWGEWQDVPEVSDEVPVVKEKNFVYNYVNDDDDAGVEGFQGDY